MADANPIPARHTDFSRFSHAELYRMLYASDPATVNAAVDTWAAVGRSLHDRATDLEQQLTNFQDKWRGPAADQYQVMLRDLIDGIRKVADTALANRDLTASAGDALRTARAKMPMPVNVPILAPAVKTAAVTPLTADGLPQGTLARLHRQQAEAQAALRAHQQTQAAADNARQGAVQVMTELAAQYTRTQAAIPSTPDAAETIDVAADVPAAPETVVTSAGIKYHTSPVLNQQPTPLFSKTYTAGLAAAVGALGGRLVLAAAQQRRAQVTIRRNTKPQALGSTAATLAKAGPGGGLGGAGLGGAGLGGTGLGGTGLDGATPDVPTANPTLPGGPGAGTVAGARAFGATAGLGTASGANNGLGYMPYLPYGGMMGMGEMGMMRRIPPWLVETEDVWGEQSPVTPSVIGEDVPSEVDPTSLGDFTWR